ncbi:MAG: Holliday junction branch migration protein RuvA [Gammaproteobacteria bacterium]|nr:Holliday junction branch migration protein RuvA [Gammaproteobacteria bacterium]
MIGFLRGRIVKKQPPGLLLDVNGVGYELEASMNTFYQLPDAGEEAELLTHLSVREDSHTLYGFGGEDERNLFRALIKVNGIGAKMALAILSGINAAEFGQCIETGDDTRLQRLPGVGKKTAQRLIVEMRDRLDGWGVALPPDKAGAGTGSRAADPVNEAVSAMISLGYRPQEASRLVHAVSAEGLDSEALIRAALKAALT